MGASLLESGRTAVLHPAVTNFAAMATAYRQQKAGRLQPGRGQLPAMARAAIPEGAQERPGRVLFQ